MLKNNKTAGLGKCKLFSANDPFANIVIIVTARDLISFARHRLIYFSNKHTLITLDGNHITL